MKKMASQTRPERLSRKTLEIILLKGKLEEANIDNLHFSSLNLSNFVSAPKQSMDSVNYLVRIISETIDGIWFVSSPKQSIAFVYETMIDSVNCLVRIISETIDGIRFSNN
ncbi:hypothetical protein L6452_43582 [Arctium lappa]|uniref:Uncharacterized protein n=1 Tax=Arctium lappa TaxID=4217 RepID=A0ACB8XDF6_ARCLA|nr:hypothetical protein L6452_43582 [Arctium lappa]